MLVGGATAADRAALDALVRRALAEAAARGRAGLRGRMLSASPDELLAGRLGADPPTLLVARAPGPVGFAILEFNELAVELAAIFVDPPARRCGVGRALLAAAERIAAARASALEVYVAAGNRAEKALLESAGYRAAVLLMQRRGVG